MGEKKDESGLKKVIVYSTQSCPWCIKSKAFLKQHNIQFEEKDVGDDAEARTEMLNKTGQMGVPVFDIDGTIVIGFDVSKIASLLNIELDH